MRGEKQWMLREDALLHRSIVTTSADERLFQSEAFRVNIEASRTLPIHWSAQEDAFLLALEGKPGLHQRCVESLRECHHPWPNLELAIDALHQLAVADYAAIRALAGFEVMLAVLEGLFSLLCVKAARPLDSGHRRRLLRLLLDWAEQEEGYDGPAGFARRVSALPHQIELLLADDELAWARASHDLRIRTRSSLLDSSAGEELNAACQKLLRRSLECNLTLWSKEGLGAMPDHSLLDPAEPLLQSLRAGLECARRWEELSALPDFEHFVEAYLTFARSLALKPLQELDAKAGSRHSRAHAELGLFEAASETLPNEGEQRLRLLLQLLRPSALQHRRDELLQLVGRSFVLVAGQPSKRAGLQSVLDAVFGALAELRRRHFDAVLDCIERVGVAALTQGSDELAEAFVEALLAFGFPRPRWEGVSDEWRVMRDPAHVHALRTWLRLIEAAPARCGALLSALVIHVRVGGVLLADTDLFQREVSRLLNADISGLLPRVVELCRQLPVFYSTVGAEGELRAVSTRIDELGRRADRLIHFLRKQIHAESNSTQIELLRRIAEYWRSKDSAVLDGFLPDDVRDALGPDNPHLRGVHALMCLLCEPEGVRSLLDATPEEQQRRLECAQADQGLGAARDDSAASADGFNDEDLARLRLLLELDRLLRAKYGLDAHSALPQLRELVRSSGLLQSAQVEALVGCIERGDDEQLLRHIYALLAELRAVIMDPRPSEAFEQIQHKRHIAAGIPSIYGRYFEPKLAAMGATFRLQSLARLHFERLLRRHPSRLVTRQSLQQTLRWLELLRDGMRLAGLQSEGLDGHLDMLRHSLSAHSFSVAQFVNLFSFIADNVQELIRSEFFLPYEKILNTVLGTILESERKSLRSQASAIGFGVREQARGSVRDPSEVSVHPSDVPSADLTTQQGLSRQGLRDRAHSLHMLAESFYRGLLSDAFMVTELDNLVSETLERLRHLQESLSPDLARQVMSFDLETLMSPLDEPHPVLDNQVFLGSKGYYLKRLHALGFSVPPGFVLSTELFRMRHAVDALPELREQIRALLRQGLHRLEEQTGHKLGNPSLPLLLSVRSGAAISMPGAMNTFLNVGLNAQVAEGLSRQPNFGWTSWDCYRRFLQTWGMSQGLARDDFDAIIMEHKLRFGVTEKVEFSAVQMQDIAFAYRSLLERKGIALVEEPFEQVVHAVRAVLASWDTERARLYRERLDIADEWGTAVIVQVMMLGNIGLDSGSGVVFTHDPFVPEEKLCLYGDFTTTSQGEDVVAGLVHPWPVSKRQLEREPGQKGVCMETQFPEIFNELNRIAAELVERHGFSHQEIEFTFESASAKDLHLLQTREQFTSPEESIPQFEGVDDGALLGSGIGVSGGALNGRVAFNLEDLQQLAEQYPQEARILLRPDTVPDDIALIFDCEGLLTARGGAASHAAVSASRLGKTCVVNCRGLKVDEHSHYAILNGNVLHARDPIALNGRLGHIYRGHWPLSVTTVRRALLSTG
ncbi:MAG: PEP/pyruvate-binding domain-containing protein [Myxococcota bacterium]|jgi:pyruvate,orthophosphate dikinase|nr:PEP/pyruvate-binding domain-containing protein [Myxococcota bacterium]